jgi:hypothetical protein
LNKGVRTAQAQKMSKNPTREKEVANPKTQGINLNVETSKTC